MLTERERARIQGSAEEDHTDTASQRPTGRWTQAPFFQVHGLESSQTPRPHSWGGRTKDGNRLPSAGDLGAHFALGLPKGCSLPAAEPLPGCWPSGPCRAWAVAEPAGRGAWGQRRSPANPGIRRQRSFKERCPSHSHRQSPKTFTRQPCIFMTLMRLAANFSLEELPAF